jgi:hypothetical protein
MCAAGRMGCRPFFGICCISFPCADAYELIGLNSLFWRMFPLQMAATSTTSKRKRDEDVEASSERACLPRVAAPEVEAIATPYFMWRYLQQPCRLSASQHLGPTSCFGPCASGDNMATHIRQQILLCAPKPDYAAAAGVVHVSLAAQMRHVDLSTRSTRASSAHPGHSHRIIFDWLVHVTRKPDVADGLPPEYWKPVTQARVTEAIVLSPEGCLLPPGLPALIASYVPTTGKQTGFLPCGVCISVALCCGFALILTGGWSGQI